MASISETNLLTSSRISASVLGSFFGASLTGKGSGLPFSCAASSTLESCTSTSEASSDASDSDSSLNSAFESTESPISESIAVAVSSEIAISAMLVSSEVITGSIVTSSGSTRFSSILESKKSELFTSSKLSTTFVVEFSFCNAEVEINSFELV